MIKDGVIVDTSVLIDFLKGENPVSNTVTRLLEKKRIVITGIIIAELLQGIKNPKEEHIISELLTGIAILEADTAMWIQAGKLSASLRRKGVSLPLTDIAVAALAIENNLSVFTLDKHFEQIPGVRIYKV
jgi:hypothetical protein